LDVNLTTLVLEIINFLVLVWILKRFIYQPVLDIIAQRRQGIERQSADAAQLQEQAVTLKQQYEERLTDWGQERQQAREALNRELETEKARQLEALQALLLQQRQKEVVADQSRRAEQVREIEHQALVQGAEFATRLLQIASGPELEARLLSLVVDSIVTLDSAQISAMQRLWRDHSQGIIVCSAYPLASDSQQQLTTALTRLVGQTLPIEYSVQPELLAGLHISIGAWVMQANLRDELKGFAEFARVVR